MDDNGFPKLCLKEQLRMFDRCDDNKFNWAAKIKIFFTVSDFTDNFCSFLSQYNVFGTSRDPKQYL